MVMKTISTYSKTQLLQKAKHQSTFHSFFTNFFHLPLNFVLLSPQSAQFFPKKIYRKQKIAYNRPNQFIFSKRISQQPSNQFLCFILNRQFSQKWNSKSRNSKSLKSKYKLTTAKPIELKKHQRESQLSPSEIWKSKRSSMIYNNFEMQKQLKNGNFVHKLEKLLNNTSYRDIISWDSTKTYIDILDPQLMQTEITPNFFRHSKFQSFVRQLNLYGFKKVKGQYRLRFTHHLLLNGQPLSSIRDYKLSKGDKRTRETISSQQNSRQVAQREEQAQIPKISINLKEQENNSTPKIIEKQIKNEQLEKRQPLIPDNSNLMYQAQYMCWWNTMMQMMAGRNPYAMSFAYGVPPHLQQQ